MPCGAAMRGRARASVISSGQLPGSTEDMSRKEKLVRSRRLQELDGWSFRVPGAVQPPAAMNRFRKLTMPRPLHPPARTVMSEPSCAVNSRAAKLTRRQRECESASWLQVQIRQEKVAGRAICMGAGGPCGPERGKTPAQRSVVVTHSTDNLCGNHYNLTVMGKLRL